MSEFAAFLKSNKPKKENVLFPACADYKDEKGNVLNWELRHLNPLIIGTIRSECTTITGKGTGAKVDGELFGRKMAAAAVVKPDLRNAELVDSYMGDYAPEDRTPDNLICLMIDNEKEYQAFLKKVFEMNGIINDTENKVETAKN